MQKTPQTDELLLDFFFRNKLSMFYLTCYNLNTSSSFIDTIQALIGGSTTHPKQCIPGDNWVGLHNCVVSYCTFNASLVLSLTLCRHHRDLYHIVTYHQLLGQCPQIQDDKMEKRTRQLLLLLKFFGRSCTLPKASKASCGGHTQCTHHGNNATAGTRLTKQAHIAIMSAMFVRSWTVHLCEC